MFVRVLAADIGFHQAASYSNPLATDHQEQPAAPSHPVAVIHEQPAAPSHPVAVIHEQPAAPIRPLPPLHEQSAAPSHPHPTIHEQPAAPNRCNPTFRPGRRAARRSIKLASPLIPPVFPSPVRHRRPACFPEFAGLSA